MLTIILFSLQAQTWMIYNMDNSVLPSDQVKAILCDKENRVWMATSNGLVMKSNDNWHVYTTEHELPDNSINSLFAENSNSVTKIWISTKKGASSVSIQEDFGIEVSAFSTSNSGIGSDSIWLASVDNNSAKWFAHGQGISGFNSEDWYLKVNSNNESNLTKVSSIASFPDGWNLFGTRGTGVARLKMGVDGISGASSYVVDYTGLWSDNIYSIFIDRLGNQWFGTDKGTSYHVGFETKEGWDEPALRRSTHQVSDTVYAIKEDNQGSIWMATPTGAVVYTGQALHTYTVADGLPNKAINDIAFDNSGNIWVATDKGIATAGIDGLLAGVTPATHVVGRTSIEKVYPVVANYLTNIVFSVAPNSEQVILQVYNLNGQLIHTLFSGRLPEGSYTKSWNCTTNQGSKVQRGMYIILLRTEAGVDMRKVIVN